MKLLALRIQGVQAHEDSTFSFGRVTTIIGDTNAGKTAAIRALRGLVENSAPKPLLRDGHKEFMVTAWVDREGVTDQVCWLKGAGKNSYAVFTGGDTGVATELKNVGAKAPEVVDSMLGLSGLLDGNGQRYFPNFRTQFDPPSMVFESESDRLSRLTKMSGVGTLQSAMRILQRDLKRVRGELKQSEAQSADLKDKVAGYFGVEAALVSAGEVSGRLEAIEEREVIFRKLSYLWDKREAFTRYDGLDQAVSRVQAVKQALSLAETGHKVKAARKSLRTTYRALTAIQPITEALRGRVDLLLRVRALVDLRASDCGDLSKETDTLVGLQGKIERCLVASRLAGLRTKLNQQDSSLSALRATLAEREAVLESARAEMGTCPVCGRSG